MISYTTIEAHARRACFLQGIGVTDEIVCIPEDTECIIVDGEMVVKRTDDNEKFTSTIEKGPLFIYRFTANKRYGILIEKDGNISAPFDFDELDKYCKLFEHDGNK